MKQYLDLLRQIRNEGQMRPSRAKLADGSQPNTQGIFGAQMRYDLSEGFPLVTTKRVPTKGLVTELLWFLRGDTNTKYLHDHGCHIWDEWADANGDLGPVYGAQWRRWGGEPGASDKNFGVQGIDQVANVIEGLKKDPFGRRHIISSWNVDALPSMRLPPCHMLCQFYVSARTVCNTRTIHEGLPCGQTILIDRDDSGFAICPAHGSTAAIKLVPDRLSCQLYQRSADMFLGVPWNIASYALLTHLVARVVGLPVGDFVHSIGDAHIYENHFAVVDEQLTRSPLALPTLALPASIVDGVPVYPKTIDDFKHENIAILGYEHHPALKGEVAV